MSACYYALFHAISDDAAALLAPTPGSPLRSAIRRTINHQQIRKACDAINTSQKTAPGSWRNLLSFPLPVEIIAVARVFIELQDARNIADYESLETFSEGEVRTFHRRATRAYAVWLSIRHTPDAAVFLTAVLLGDRLGKRG